MFKQGQRMNKSLVRKDFRKEACVVHAVLHLPSEAVLQWMTPQHRQREAPEPAEIARQTAVG